MNELRLAVACWDYDRVRPLMDGRVRVNGGGVEQLDAGVLLADQQRNLGAA